MSESGNVSDTKRLRTPVLFLIFNRPDTTMQVFEAIRRAQPPRLYIAADGARIDRVGEKEKVQAVRDLVIGSINWDCEVKTLFRDTNLGCKHAVSSAITWFFEHEEMGIILEDDCYPDESFFQFCQELLEKYKDDNRIAMISGNNFQFGKQISQDSYYFSKYTHIWGWASWRRAWNNYDVTMALWPEIRDGHLWRYFFKNIYIYHYWKYIFDKTYRGDNGTWDYQWLFTSWIQNQLTILPSKNLVANIGFGPEAVHTKRKNECANIRCERMEFPLIHPKYIHQNYNADYYTEENSFSGGNPLRKAFRIIKGLINVGP